MARPFKTDLKFTILAFLVVVPLGYLAVRTLLAFFD